jgi:flagellar basal-body rod protein FlgF
MIYGLYLSATGIMTSSYKQDVIANNLANSETTGFKRDLPDFRQRLTAAQERRSPGSWSDPLLEGMGGGLLIQPNHSDFAQGDMKQTGSPLDVAIQGEGFFKVDDHGKPLLTRDGRFMVNHDGLLVLTGGQKVLDSKNQPIQLSTDSPVSIQGDGQITQGGQTAAKLGVFDVPDKRALTKVGNDLLTFPKAMDLTASNSALHSEYLEQSNVDSTTEMAELMDTQRQLEANANMIHTQDSTLQLLVNNVGKIT